MKGKLYMISLLIIIMSYHAYSQKATNSYAVVNKFHVDGDGGWDYLTSDDNTGRLFISHSTVVEVISSSTGKLLGRISNLQGVHGITLDMKDRKGFISSGKDSSVCVFDLKDYKEIKRVKVTGANPDAILYDNFSDQVFAFNGRSSNATVIDAKSLKITGTVSLPGKPEFSVTDDNGNIFVNIEDKSMICMINAKTLKIINSWPLAPGESPSGLAIDKKQHRLFTVCDNRKMVVLNALDGKIITTVDIGDNVDGCVFDPVMKRVFSSNGEGNITVVQQGNDDKYSVIQTIPTQAGARTICIDNNTHHLYLPVAETLKSEEQSKVSKRPRKVLKPGTFTILDIALKD